MTIDCNSRFVYLDAFSGGAHAVAEAARNLVCVGAQPLALTDCLNFGNPEKPEVFYTFIEAVKGMSAACEELKTPVIGGNVSFYNESYGNAIHPTPTVGMVGLLEDIAHNTTLALPQSTTVLFLMGATADEIGGSEYLAFLHGIVSGKPPIIDLNLEHKVQNCLLEAIRTGIVAAAHDCSEGGIAVALAEMAIAGKTGAVINLDDRLSDVASCFSESASRIIIAVSEDKIATISKLAEKHGIPMTQIGYGGSERFSLTHNGVQLIDIALPTMTDAWEGALRCHLN